MITYALSQYNTELVPAWVTFNATLGKLTGTLPQVSVNTTFNFYIDATSSEWTGVLQKLITINVIVPPPPVPAPVPATVPKTEVTPEASTEAKAAATSAQAGTAAVVGVSTVGSMFSGSNPTVIWTILNQLQMLVLILLVDNFLPTDIESYMQGVEFALVSFDFLPVMEVGFVNSTLEWMDFEQPNLKLEMIGFNSRSTSVNIVGVILVLILIVLVHVTL